jgi:hypothetical protein
MFPSLFASFVCFGLALICAALPQDSVFINSRDVSSGNGNNGSIDIKAELLPQLSQGASIILPPDSTWANETERWSLYSAPTFRAVVEVASEQDVQAAVSAMKSYPSMTGYRTKADPLGQQISDPVYSSGRPPWHQQCSRHDAQWYCDLVRQYEAD